METHKTPNLTEHLPYRLQDENPTLLLSVENHGGTDSHEPASSQLQDQEILIYQTISLADSAGQQHTTFNQFPNTQGSVLLAGEPHVQIKSSLNSGRVGIEQGSIQSHYSAQSQVDSIVQPPESKLLEQFQRKHTAGSSSAQNTFLFQPEIKTEIFVDTSDLTEPQGLTLSQLQTPHNNHQRLMTPHHNTCQQDQLLENLMAASHEPTALSEKDGRSSNPCSLSSQLNGNVSQMDQIAPRHHNQTSVSLSGQRSSSSLLISVEQTQDLLDASQAIDIDVSPHDTHTTHPAQSSQELMDTQDVSLDDTNSTDPNAQSSNSPVIIDEEDILILWNLIAESKQLTNGDTARYLLSLYFNPRQEDAQSTDSCCVHCGRRLSFCCVSCVVASKQTPATKPTIPASQTSQAAEQEIQIRDFSHKGLYHQPSAKTVPLKNTSRKTRRLKNVEIIADRWKEKFNITKTAAVQLTRCDSVLKHSVLKATDQSSTVTRRLSTRRSLTRSQSISNGRTVKHLKSNRTTTSVHSNQIEQSRSSFSKISQHNSSASVHLNSTSRKRVSFTRQQDKRPARTVCGNKSENNERSEAGNGVISLIPETENDVTSPLALNFDSDSDIAEPMQFEDDCLDPISPGNNCSETPKTETVFQDSSTALSAVRDPLTLVQKPVSLAKDSTTLAEDPSSMTQCSANLDPGIGAEADSSVSFSSDQVLAPGSRQKRTSARPRASTKNAFPESDQEGETKDKYPICDGIHFKDGRIKPNTRFSKYACSNCGKTFRFKKFILRHIENPSCDANDSDQDWTPSSTKRTKVGKNPETSDDDDDDDFDDETSMDSKRVFKKGTYMYQKFQKPHTMEEFMTGKIQIPLHKPRGAKIQLFSHHTCSKCCKVFVEVKDYKDHKCDPKFELSPAQGPDPESLNLLKQILESRAFKCPHCDKVYFNELLHQKHVSTHEYCIYNNDVFTCLFCGEPFVKLPYLKRHVFIVKEHKKTCKECGFKFTSLCQIQGHKNEHKKKKFTEPCQICGISFDCWKKKDITRHFKTHKELRKTVLCTVCGKDVLAGHYSQHLVSHSDKRPYVCSQCGKCFKTNVQLRYHQIQHGEKRFQCEECGASFHFMKLLKAHVNWQHLKKGFACTECGKKISSQKRLSQHVIRVHQKGRRFPCDYCDLTFWTEGLRKVHVRVHTGEKPFACEFCGQRFARKDYLRFHTRIHTQEKPYKCLDCGQGFATRTSYTSHRKARHPNSWVSCEHCGKVFPDKADLGKHTDRFHDPNVIRAAHADTLHHDPSSKHVARTDSLLDMGTTHAAHTDTIHDTDNKPVHTVIGDVDFETKLSS